MDTFIIGTRRYWLFRALGRNTLVRRSDRVEAWSVVVAVLVLAVATPFVCAFGTSVHDARARLYAQEALHRHSVIATAMQQVDRDVEPGNTVYTARARWNAGGQEHIDLVKWPTRANVGDQQRIWVDDNGRNVLPPRPSSRAATDALVLAFAVWFGLFSAVAGTLCVIRWQLDSQRFAQWDLEINRASDGGDRRKPQ